MPNRRKTTEPLEASKSANDTPFPSLGLDLDGTIDEAPLFFRWLAANWPGKVYIITYRADRAKAEADVAKHKIEYDELILVRSFSEKAEVIEREGIVYYFDDQDEMTANIPEERTVFKIRNGGNFCYESKKWLYSDQTGRQV